MEPLALYVHVPYCVRKCAYCDFNAYSGARPAEVETFVDAVCREIEASPSQGRPAATVFFGGGTPTYLTGGQIARILQSIKTTFAVEADAEISSEANPSTVDAERFRAMREAGFNRLSIGVQSLNDRVLQQLDRTHSAAEAVNAVEMARAAGFRNLSLDLMFGLPSQTMDDWRETLEKAIALDAPHLSTYALTLEPGTRFERLHLGGKLDLPAEEDELTMYEHAIERLTAAGYDHYEVSNFAKPGFQSRHNLVYWHNQEHLGFGPGAVSYLAGRRWTNEKNPAIYAEKVARGIDLAVDSEQLNPESALAETLIQGLRLREGIVVSRLGVRFGIDVERHYADRFSRLGEKGLLNRTNGRIRLTDRGLLLANDVAIELLP